jgi:AraC-like DNA-binding protein
VRVPLQPVASAEEMHRQPVGHWLATGNGLLWCHSPELVGMAVWGRPTAADARAMLRVLDGYRCLAPRFDILQDASAVDSIDPDALAELLAWVNANRDVLRDHVRSRVGVIPPGLSGLALAGIAPALELATSPVAYVDSALDGFRRLLPDGGDALHAEVQRVIEQVSALSPLVLGLRRALVESRGDLDLAEAARRLGISARSLQRQLADTGLSFRSEQADARFRAAEELLRGDDKLAAVAARLGLSEDGLTQLVRARTGLTPGDLRRRLRGG